MSGDDKFEANAAPEETEMKHIILTTMLVALLLPAAAMSAVMSSPSYRINGASIVSGGGASTDAEGNSKAGIAIGQTVFRPSAGISSPSYKAQTAVIASPEAGGIHSGDISNDGRVDIVDALLALKAGVGLVALTTQEITPNDIFALNTGYSPYKVVGFDTGSSSSVTLTGKVKTSLQVVQ
jgi:hypothetical protein